MNCERRDLAIAKLAGGDLLGWRATKLQRHLESCPRCAQLFAELEAQCTATHESYPIAESNSITDTVLSRVDQRGLRGNRSGLRVRAATGVLCAVLLIGTAIWQLSAIDAPSSPQTVTALTPHYDPPAAHEPVDLTATEHSDVKIQMVTNNPDVVIYWLGDSAGDD
jgi:anti-sigma factor RsiW